MVDQKQLSQIVRTAVMNSLRVYGGKYYVPAASSNKHIHLSRAGVDKLFGPGYQLTPMRPLSQPGQFACEETLTFVGSKGELKKMRVLGPERKETQVELAVTDCFKAGVKVVIRMSGDLEGTPGGKLIGPAGEVEIDHGVIVAQRHLHLSTAQAAEYKLHNGDIISLSTGGDRPVIFQNVIVRAGQGHEMEVHIDTDEANAANLKNGALLEIIRD